MLHLMLFRRDPLEELDPAEELYAFLENEEIELEEDEVEDVDLGGTGSLAVCEYLEEEEEEEGEDGEVYWLIGVATAPGRLLFASYSCSAEERERERDAIRGILSSIRFDAVQ